MRLVIALVWPNNLIIATDHKPLVPILNDRRQDLIKKTHLLSMKEKTLLYRFVAQHIPGPSNFAADATSRNPSRWDDGYKSLFPFLASQEDDYTVDAEVIALNFGQFRLLPG